jgi:hypothetical protein
MSETLSVRHFEMGLSQRQPLARRQSSRPTITNHTPARNAHSPSTGFIHPYRSHSSGGCMGGLGVKFRRYEIAYGILVALSARGTAHQEATTRTARSDASLHRMVTRQAGNAGRRCSRHGRTPWRRPARRKNRVSPTRLRRARREARDRRAIARPHFGVDVPR